MAQWIGRNQKAWEHLLEDFPRQGMTASARLDEAAWPELYRDTCVIHVFYAPEKAAFSVCFKGSYDGEITRKLVYTPESDQATGLESMLVSGGAWQMPLATVDSCRWEGGGINGKGYVAIECLTPGWFYVETYLPT